MSGFVFHPSALTDLDEIWEFIAGDSLAAADRVLDKIIEVIGSFVAFPRMGHRRPELTSRPLRFHPVHSFVIVYAPDE
jgi:plasmid stabilization system protein ParE